MSESNGHDKVVMNLPIPGRGNTGQVFQGWKTYGKQYLIICLLIAILASQSLVLYYGAKAGTQNRSAQVLLQVKHIADEVDDVVTPGGKIHDENAKASADALASVNAAGIARLKCSVNYIAVITHQPGVAPDPTCAALIGVAYPVVVP